LLEPARAARPAFAVIVLADQAALPVEDHHGRVAAPALPARLVDRVGREVSGVDGRARHDRASQLSRRPRARCHPGQGAADHQPTYRLARVAAGPHRPSCHPGRAVAARQPRTHRAPLWVGHRPTSHRGLTAGGPRPTSRRGRGASAHPPGRRARRLGEPRARVAWCQRRSVSAARVDQARCLGLCAPTGTAGPRAAHRGDAHSSRTVAQKAHLAPFWRTI
jgi:hypothetical protein